jgi:hypothetical protein
MLWAALCITAILAANVRFGSGTDILEDKHQGPIYTPLKRTFRHLFCCKELRYSQLFDAAL